MRPGYNLLKGQVTKRVYMSNPRNIIKQEKCEEKPSSSTLAISHAFQAQNTINEQQQHFTLYDILGITCHANASEIKAAFRKLALTHHPDKGGDAEKFKKIQHAHSILGDAEKRNKYDKIMNDPEKEYQYCHTLFKDSCNAIFKEMDSSLEHLKIRAIVEKDRKSCITPWVYPVDTSWGAAKIFATTKKDKILYSVGKLIRFSEKSLQFRQTISISELIDSFLQHEKKIMLFLVEFDALQYSRATRVGSFYEDQQCFQSPIVEVKLLTDLGKDIEIKKLDAFINDRYKQSRFFGNSYIFYAEIDASHVEALTVSLKIETAAGDKEYPPISFYSGKGELQVNNESPSYCRA